MAFPVGVTLIPVSWGKGVGSLGDGLKATLTITAVFAGTPYIVWEATGDPFFPLQEQHVSDENFQGVVNVPAVDQDGWIDASGAAFTNWVYSAKIRYELNDTSVEVTKVLTPLETQTGGIDFDILPVGSAGTPMTGPLSVVTSVNGETGAVTIDVGGGGGGLDDSGVAALIGDDASNTKIALDATYAPIDVTGAVDSVNGATGVVVLDADDIASGTVGKQFTATLLTKLNGIATGATANDTDANLKSRANHTGTQTAATISDFVSQVNALIGAVVGAAPGALDTLLEIDNAINNDPNFATTMTTALAGKVPVTLTIAGHALSGNVTLVKADVGLSNVDNTSDANKPTSIAQLASIVAAIAALTKSSVGLSNVDNTSDANKPVSTAQATAIAKKDDTVTYNFVTSSWPDRPDDLSTHSTTWKGPTAPPVASVTAHKALPRDSWMVVTA